MTQTSHRRSRTHDLLPLSYGVIALLVLLVLPSALRPPPDAANNSAEFSPDAPPDEDQESPIETLQRAVSGTAGDGLGSGGSGEGPGGTGPGGTELAVAAPPAPARACPHGYGSPPRQTFSYFSAPCAPPFVGDNGGATSKGVTGDVIRVAISDPNGDHGREGPVPDRPYPDENTDERTFRVIQHWFNTRYQFWGRRLQLVVINGNSVSDVPRQRAVAVKADSYGVFAFNGARYPTIEELARRKVIAFAEQGDFYSGSWLADRRPYAWNTPRSDATHLMRLSAEFACKSMMGRPARFAGDPTMHAVERKLGFVFQNNEGYRRTDPEFRAALAERCGEKVAISIGFPGDGSSSGDAETHASAVSRLRTEGVTTVVAAMNFFDTASLTSTATSQGYFPEWMVTGMGLLDVNFDASLQEQRQWAHAFGIGAATIGDGQSIPGADMRWEIGYRAYKEIEPATSPADNIIIRLFPQLEQIANGIQMAGPRLTPETFEKALLSTGVFAADVPPWEMVGGFGPGDYSFADKAGLIWWDPAATSDNTSNAGAYRWLNGGKRYGLGEFPEGEHPDLFVRGITRRGEATG